MLLWRKTAALDNRAGRASKRQIHPAKRPASCVRLHDRDAGDLMADSQMPVAGDYHVDETGRYCARDVEDLLACLAGREVEGIIETLASSAGMSGDDDD